jgi:hypothetical protein
VSPSVLLEAKCFNAFLEYPIRFSYANSTLDRNNHRYFKVGRYILPAAQTAVFQTVKIALCGVRARFGSPKRPLA